MKIQLVAIDMDGTLLNNQGKVSEKNQTILKKAMDAGIFIVPATGRMLNTLPVELQNMEKIAYVITSNGAAVYETSTKQPIATDLMPISDVLSLFDIFSEFDIIVEAYIDGHGYYEQNIFNRLDEFQVPTAFREQYANRKTGVEHLADFIKAKNRPVEKINLPWLKQDIKERLIEILKDLNFISLTSSLKENIEINHAGVNKGNGLKQLCKILNLKKSQVMAIGDNLNDADMLLAAGHAVAMENAIDEIKAISTFITKSNSEDGVAHAIETLIFEEEKK